jgi:hypothetical protein
MKKIYIIITFFLGLKIIKNLFLNLIKKQMKSFLEKTLKNRKYQVLQFWQIIKRCFLVRIQLVTIPN